MSFFHAGWLCLFFWWWPAPEVYETYGPLPEPYVSDFGPVRPGPLEP